MNLGLIYCAWDADKNKQQLQKFLFGISTTKKQNIGNKKCFQQATTQPTGHQ